MALPVPRESEHDEQAMEECVFRPVRQPDGRWEIEQLPLLEDAVTGDRLLTSEQEEMARYREWMARRAAEARATSEAARAESEAAARREAEAELARLREEIARRKA